MHHNNSELSTIRVLPSLSLPKSKVLILVVSFLLSGTCALAYQVVWARLLALLFGSTTQAIATVLAVFMLGLAVGSYIGGKITQRNHGLGQVYGILEIVLGIYA